MVQGTYIVLHTNKVERYETHILCVTRHILRVSHSQLHQEARLTDRQAQAMLAQDRVLEILDVF